MARKPRIHYPGALYHVMVRGNNGETVFAEEAHKREYIGKLSYYKKQFCFKLFHSENSKQAVKQYQRFMELKPEETTLGDFRELQSAEKTAFRTSIGIQNGPISIEEVIEKVCAQEKVSINEIVRKTRIRKISDIRKAIVLLSERHCSVTNTLLAQKLNLPLSMISKIKSGVSKGTDNVQEIIRSFEEGISE